MKGFGIEIKNNLLDSKHVEAMGISVWLYMWMIDKMTSIGEDGVGLVLGGKPIKFNEVGEELGIGERTYTRWVKDLSEGGYLNVKRTPYGLIFSVNKAFKHFGRRTDKNGVSEEKEISHNRRISQPEMADLSDKSGGSNKTVSVDTTVNTSVRGTPSQIARSFFDGGPEYIAAIDFFSMRAPRDIVTREMGKFIAYWTEPNKSGTKVRWEQQSTFEIKRRLTTWFGNIKARGFSATQKLVNI